MADGRSSVQAGSARCRLDGLHWQNPRACLVYVLRVGNDVKERENSPGLFLGFRFSMGGKNGQQFRI